MACEEAELGPDGFEQKMKAQQQLQEQVMSSLVITRKFPFKCNANYLNVYCSN